MYIEIKYLLEVPDLDDLRIQIDTADLEKSHIFSLKNGEIIKQHLVTKTYLAELVGKQVFKVTIVPEDHQFAALISFLRQKFPDEFAKPTRSFSLKELANVLEMYEEMNLYSDKKRDIFNLQDISVPSGSQTAKNEVLIPYGTQLDHRIIQKAIKRLSENFQVECLETEKGILIVTISRNQEDTLNTIMAATDLVARLEKHFQLDLAYDGPEAIEKFKKNQPKLVVFGNYKYKDSDDKEVINTKAQYTYLELRYMDVYLKSLFINQINLQENRDNLALEILREYKLPYAIRKVESKVPLKEPDKKKYLTLLDTLNKNFSREDYLKLSIQFKCLEPVYHISFLKTQLDNIAKLHSFSAK